MAPLVSMSHDLKMWGVGIWKSQYMAGEPEVIINDRGASLDRATACLRTEVC